MNQCLKRNWKRCTSGFLAFIMASTLVIGDAGIALGAQDMERFTKEGVTIANEDTLTKTFLKNASFKNHKEEELSLSVFADEDNRYLPGNEICLDVHMKNETGEILTGGVLTYKARDIDEGNTYFELDEGALELLEVKEEEELATASNADADETFLLKKVEGIRLAPGQIFTARLVLNIEEDVQKAKEQKVEFCFEAENEAGEPIKKKEIFYYTVNHLNMDTVEFENGNRIETGEEVIMGIRSRTFSDDLVLVNSQLENLLEEAAAELATASDASLATPSEGDEEAEDDFVVNMDKTAYEIQMFNAKLNDFKVRKVVNEDPYDNLLLCTFRVSSSVEPGVYFGKITQKSRMNGKTYRSSQGFSIIVTGDGEISLSGKVGDAEVVVSGPAGSFPEADQLSVRVSEVEPEQQEQVDEALAKKAEEEGVEVNAYKALDIKIYADGEETEPTGPIQVAFKNIQLKKETPMQRLEETVTEMISVFTGEEEESAGDTGEAAEDENAEIRVFHLDEENVVANEMVSTVEEDGTVMMDTDHFSVYIVVDMNQLGGEITLTIEHWAKVDAFKGSADASKKTDSIFGKVNNPVAGKTVGKINTEPIEVAIYEPDSIKIPNKAPIKTIEDLSKVWLAGSSKNIPNYKIAKIWLLDPNGNITYKNQKWKEYAPNSNAEIKLSANAKIRVWYDPVKADNTLKQPATFYDYNITDGHTYKTEAKANAANRNGSAVSANNNGNKDGWVSTKTKYGINYRHSTVAKGTPVFQIGQPANGIKYQNTDDRNEDKFNGKSLNHGNDLDGLGIVENIVTGLTDDYTKVKVNSGIHMSDFFSEGTLQGKEVLNGFHLVFDQNGDTYTLGEVRDADDVRVSNDLQNIKYIAGDSWSNNFWPLDQVMYSGKDPNFGADRGTVENYWSRSHIASAGYRDKSASYLPASDDEKGHNYFFGMRTDFDFTIGDYTGPMNFYFRGDDDFWLFVDGKLAVDIGGIHLAAGESLDIRKFINDNNLHANDKNYKHRLTIVYAERGGFGSCCYIQFTLPNVKPVSFDTSVPKGTVTVKKQWNDAGNPYRPDSIVATLQYKHVGDSEFTDYDTQVLNAGNNWQYTWGDIPKDGYTYRIVEQGVPDGYQVKFEGTGVGTDGSFTLANSTSKLITIKNSLSPEVNVIVEKEWDDNDNSSGNRPDSVKMLLLTRALNSQDTWKIFPGNKAVLVLDGKVDAKAGETGEYASWKGKYAGLPGLVDGTFVEYMAIELDGNGSFPDNSAISGLKQDGTPFQVSGHDTLKGKYYSSAAADKNDWFYNISYEVEKLADSKGNGRDYTDGAGTAHKDVSVAVTVTNTFSAPLTTAKVIKTWKNVPDALNAKVKLELWQRIGDGAAIKTTVPTGQSNPVELTKPVGGFEESYTWINLPKYERDQKITYLVYELDKNGQPVKDKEAVKVLEDGYQYEVTTENNNGVANITNKLSAAELLVKKVVLSNDLDHEPIDQEYKFLIQVQGSNGNDFTSTLALGHEETSGTIVLTPPESGETFTVSEITPMEYDVASIKLQEQPLGYSLWDGIPFSELSRDHAQVTVKPGKRYLVTVTNTPVHEGYFHHTASVTNKKDLTSGTTNGNFQSKNEFSEIHGTGAGSANKHPLSGRRAGSQIMALVTEDTWKIEEETQEKGDDLFG